VRPAFAEPLGGQRPAHLPGRVPPGPAVCEVPGSNLVHRHHRQRGAVEVRRQPQLLIGLGQGRVGWRHVESARRVRFMWCGGEHACRRYALRLGHGRDLAVTVEVGDQAAVAGPRNDFVDDRRHARHQRGGARVDTAQCRHRGLHRRVEIDPPACFVQERGEPFPFGVSPRGQLVDIHRGRLGCTQQAMKRCVAHARGRLTVFGCLLQVADEARVGAASGVLVVGQEAGQPTGQRKGGLRDGCRHPVQGLDGRVDGVGPLRKVAVARCPAVAKWCVLAVIAGQIQVEDVPVGVHPIQLKFSERCADRGDGGGKLGLIVGIGQRIGGRGRQRTQPRLHPLR